MEEKVRRVAPDAAAAMREGVVRLCLMRASCWESGLAGIVTPIIRSMFECLQGTGAHAGLSGAEGDAKQRRKHIITLIDCQRAGGRREGDESSLKIISRT